MSILALTAAAAAAPAANKNPYGLWEALQQGGIIAWSVFLILCLTILAGSGCAGQVLPGELSTVFAVIVQATRTPYASTGCCTSTGDARRSATW